MLRLRRCPVCRRILAATAICFSCLTAAPTLPDAPEREPAPARTRGFQVAISSTAATTIGPGSMGVTWWIPPTPPRST
jgi:hypothetical protein